MSSLLSPEDPPAVTEWEPHAGADSRGILILCDHARPNVPKSLGALGLAAADFHRHIAYDIGALGVAETLARRWAAPLVASAFSRLVVDCNRRGDDPSAIPAVSDGTRVPGNEELGEAARAARRREIFLPYHGAIARRLDRAAAAGVAPVIVSMHSCTPVMNGHARPWHIGVLWNEDGRVARPLIAALARLPGVTVGDNEPYSGRDGHGFTLPHHAEQRGLPHVLIEVRQDLIGDPAGIISWSEILDQTLGALIAR